SSSPNVFGSTKRSLAVVIQSSFSQVELNSHINNGLTALLKYMGQADAFDEYIVSTFNTITVQNLPYAQVQATPYSTSTAFLNATTSSAIKYQNSQSDTQPSLDALLQTINTISYDKSSIFLFTDAPPYANTSGADMPNIVLAAVERQLQINVIVTAPYGMNSICMQYANSSIYSQLALQTGGAIINLCQPYANSYPRDIITEFFTGYGITHHHVETLQEILIADCSTATQTQFYIDNPSASVYAFVNSDQVESFDVGVFDNDSAGDLYKLPSQVLTPFFGIYQVVPNLYNRNGYTLQVQAAANSTSGSCSVRIVEKTQLAVYLGFTPDPSKDSPSLTLKYAIAANPVIHISSQFQSDVQPNIVVLNSDETVRYNATGTRRLPSCHYESFFSAPFACKKPYSYFLSTVTLKTNETTMQRTQRAYCYMDPTICLNGGSAASDGTCQCRPGFNGAKCESPICQNGGIVVDYKCVCEAGFNGQFCQYIACQEWNYLETHDVRQHEFRQITFVIERNIAMVLPSVYLQQVNIFFMQLQDYPQQPSDFLVPMIARQSGGRLLPLTVLAARDISGVLNSIVKENALLYDDGFKDCTTAQQVSFFVESTASRVILDVTGNDVATAGAVSVLDGAGKIVPVNPRNALMNDAAALVIDFAMQPSGPAGGQWTVTIKTTNGSCFIQARAESPIHVIPGFSSSPDLDVVKSGPFSSLGTNASVYVTARVTNARDTNYGVTLDSLTIVSADFSAPWQDKPLLGQSIHPRDPVGCASQFVTDQFTSPKTTYQKYTMSGVDAKGTKFQRTFFYSQPVKADSVAQCVHGTRNPYGECGCDNRYTGDYCNDRVCLNGGTASLGTCVCVNGFYGDFCENALTDAPAATSTTKPGLDTTTNGPSITTPQTPTIATSQTSAMTTSQTSPIASSTGLTSSTSVQQPSSTSVQQSTAVSSTAQPSAGTTPTMQPSTTTSSRITSTPSRSTTNGITPTPPLCFPTTTTFRISFLIDASNISDMFLTTEENVIKSVANRFELGSGQQQTSFIVSGMAESYISGGTAKKSEDIDADINRIAADDRFGSMVLNAGESLQGYLDSPDSSINCCGPPFVIVLMGQQSKDNMQDSYTNLRNRRYEMLAIDMTGNVAPSLIPVFGSKNVKSYTGTLDSLTDWIQDRICRIKYSEP
ncbi:hypothetical protein Y032_0617g699, partial [Ancylostoma ceylanicum]